MSEIIQVAGCWLGIAASGAQVFSYHWCLHQVEAEVTGTISISESDGSSPGSYEMRGTIRGSALLFAGTQFVKNPGRWCMAAGRLQFSVLVDGSSELRGYWGPLAIPGGCPQGTGGAVVLRRG